MSKHYHVTKNREIERSYFNAMDRAAKLYQKGRPESACYWCGIAIGVISRLALYDDKYADHRKFAEKCYRFASDKCN